MMQTHLQELARGIEMKIIILLIFLLIPVSLYAQGWETTETENLVVHGKTYGVSASASMYISGTSYTMTVQMGSTTLNNGTATIALFQPYNMLPFYCSAKAINNNGAEPIYNIPITSTTYITIYSSLTSDNNNVLFVCIGY